MGNSIQKLELFHGDFIDFIQGVEARNVLSVTFDSIDKLIFSRIAVKKDISIGDLVFVEDSSDLKSQISFSLL